jgi:hypothetical protein
MSRPGRSGDVPPQQNSSTALVSGKAGDEGRWTLRFGVGLALVVAASALVTLSQIDALLMRMHVAGAGSYGMNALVRLFPSPPGAHKTVQTWQAWAQTPNITIKERPRALADLYFWIDTFAFIPAYGFLLFVLVRRLDAVLPDDERSKFRRRALHWTTFGAIPALIISDVVENLSQRMLVHRGGSSSFFSALGSIAWCGKWSFLAVTIITIVASAVAALSSPTNAIWTAVRWRQLVICRVNVLLAGFLVLIFFGPATLSEQAADAIRRLADDWAPIVSLLLVEGVLAAVLLATSVWLVANSGALQELRKTERHYGPPLIGILTSLVVGAGFFLLMWLVTRYTDIAGGNGFYVAAGIAFVLTFLSLPLIGIDRPRPAAAYGESLVPPMLAAAPLVTTGLAIVAASVASLLSSADASVGLLVLGLALEALGLALYVVARGTLSHSITIASRGKPRFRWLALGGTVAAVAIGIGAWLSPWWWSRVLDGTVGVVLLFCLASALIGFALVGLTEMVAPPPSIAFVGLRRIPVLSLMLIWFVLSSYVDPAGFHSIRTRSGSSAAVETIDQAFVRWRPPLGATGTPARATAARNKQQRRVVPLVFVSAVGGGIRAAYWTALVLGCLTEKAPPCQGAGPRVPKRNLFAASGASGGSLGIVTYAAAADRGEVTSSPAIHLRGDYLAPTMARMLFVDFPNSFLRLHGFDDRGAVLERAWERSWKPETTLQAGLFARRKQWPLLFLNGTSVLDGCRFETSTIATSSRLRHDRLAGPLVDGCLSLRHYDTQPPPHGSDYAYLKPASRTWSLAGTKDLSSFLCPDKDIRLSTAALLSARFPFVSPSGRVRCGGGPSAYVVDGGYWDNTATETLIELWDHLQPRLAAYNANPLSSSCLVPVLIEIDNHYLSVAGPGHDARPKEVFVPTTTLGTVRNGREADSREEAALLFSAKDFAPNQSALLGRQTLDRVAHFYPQAHPGIQAPLGWTLSKSAQTDLEDQVHSGGNLSELKKVRSWFSGNVRCSIRSA